MCLINQFFKKIKVFFVIRIKLSDYLGSLKIVKADSTAIVFREVFSGCDGSSLLTTSIHYYLFRPPPYPKQISKYACDRRGDEKI